MGYLNNTSVTIDAILTDKGRQYLANNQQDLFAIQYFALGDDEINYDLWNPAHPLGTDYYGIVIENMPLLEAFPIADYNLRSKLVSLPQNTSALPTITNLPASVDFTYYETSNQGLRQSDIEPRLTVGDNSLLGYTCYYNPKYVTVTALTKPSNDPSITTYLGDSTVNSTSAAVVGSTFRIAISPNINRASLPYSANTVTFPTPIIIIGNGLGGRYQLNANITYVTSN